LPTSSVWPLLEYLRAERLLVPEAGRVVSAVELLVGEYRTWLSTERGLAPTTIRSSEQVAHRFLGNRASTTDPQGVAAVTACEVNTFLLRESSRVRAASAGCYASRLRSLLRYLAVRGFVDPALADAVPRVARWRGATIPQFPPRPEIDRLLKSCDRTTDAGARDYVVLLLLARLGLRSIEVSRLRLEDLDWQAGEITIEGKAHQPGRLPLPSDIGDALVAHLRYRGRRPGQQRVFLTVHAPIQPLEASGVRTIVRNACRRAGIEHVPAHQLRHALASDLLREGASMIAIGQVLRHKSLESTAIYAKVDLQRLRQAARPWPGAAR
jgi:integrase